MTALCPKRREQLVRLSRAPIERPAGSPTFHALQRDGLAVGRPLTRPSGKPSRYREWSITQAGLEFLQGRR